jgi:hypothetical protein
MKKRGLFIIALFFFASALFAQQLNYKFANPRIIRIGGFDYFEFDVQVKAAAAGTYMFTGQINLNYDNNTLSTTAAQWTYTVAPAFLELNTLGVAKYAITKTLTGVAPNKVLNFAFAGEAGAFSNSPFEPLDWVEMTTSYQTMVTVRGRIISATGLAGIKFVQPSMNGNQEYIYDEASTLPYNSPNLYEAADFTSAYVGRLYSTLYDWSQVGNTVNAQWVNWTTAVNTSVWEGAATIPGGSESKVSSLYIHSPATLTIPATGQLTASGTTSLNGSQCLIIQSSSSSEGSFLDNGFSGSGTAKIQRFVNDHYLPSSTNRWEYVSSPIASAYSDIFTNASPVRALYYAAESSNSWESYTAASPQLMNVMQGYTRKYVQSEGDGNTTKDFIGLPNTGSKSINVYRTENAPGAQHGYNLVGNPYTSAIDWEASSGWTRSGIDHSIYYRSNGNYGIWNGAVGTNNATQYIPPFQAFWVRVTSTGSNVSTSLGCTNSVRVHNSQNIYKTTSVFTNTLHLTATNNANGLTDDTYVIFDPNATDGFDSQFDAYKMFAADTAYPQVYTNDNLEDLAINNLSDLVGERTVPLGFKTTISGQFTLSADMISTFTDNGNTVYLEDIQTGMMQDLSANGTYQFTSGVTSGLNRLVLHFNPSITSITEDVKKQIQLFGYNNAVNIKSLNLLEGNVTVYDILGQVVATKHLSGTTSDVIHLETKCAVYTVKYTTSDKTITRRIFINQ